MRMLTIVEGEQHYRVRVAIDRFTGEARQADRGRKRIDFRPAKPAHRF